MTGCEKSSRENQMTEPCSSDNLSQPEVSFARRGWLVPAAQSQGLNLYNSPSGTASLEHASFGDIERVLQMYLVSDKNTVRNYLQANQFLVALLINASFALGKHFPNFEKELLVVEDREIVGRNKLYVSVRAENNWESARTATRAFDTGWWFNNMACARGKLSIDVN